MSKKVYFIMRDMMHGQIGYVVGQEGRGVTLDTGWLDKNAQWTREGTLFKKRREAIQKLKSVRNIKLLRHSSELDMTDYEEVQHEQPNNKC